MVASSSTVTVKSAFSLSTTTGSEITSGFFGGISSVSRWSMIGSITMKMISRTSSTSINGVTLISFEPEGFFGAELFESSHTGVVKAVLEGRADAGATYAERPADGHPITRAGFVAVAPERKVRVLEWTATIPNDVIAGHGLLSKEDHRIFSNAILTLAEREDGRKLLYNAFHAERFLTTPRNTLRPLYDLVRLARAHGLLAHL